jgi:SNF2 family DNA or RNA helicase
MAIDNIIKVDYDADKRRLVMLGGFHLLDVFRSFPSRRFDPKTKAWRMPLVKQNLNHFNAIRDRYQWKLTPEAIGAMMDFDRITAAPVYSPVPRLAFHGSPYQPMEHQWDMMDKGWDLNGYALFAAMGTGKTFVGVNLARMRFEGRRINRLIVICPQTLRTTWRREFEKYAPGLADCYFHGGNNHAAYKYWCDDISQTKQLKVLLVSVEGLGISERLADSVFSFFQPDSQVMVICDESSRIKNPSAKRTERTINIAGYCKYRMILNGTPIARGIQDLWSQYEFLDPNIIGSGDYWAFKTRYVVMGGYENKQIVGYSNVEELMKLIQPFTLEVDKKILNLPPKIYKTRIIKASPEQQKLFDKILSGLEKEEQNPVEAWIKTQNVLERMLRLQQVIGGFEPRTDRETEVTLTYPLATNPKLDDLKEFIDDNFEGTKFVVWARYIPEIELITASLRQKYGAAAVVDYYGATSSADRTIAEDRYCNDPTCRFLVGNPAAAGLGLTFVSGENDVMYYYSGTFAYIDRTQSEDRSHRIGQQHTTVVVDPIMEGTLDEAIAASIKEKKSMDQFVKDWISAGKSVRDLVHGVGL